MTDYRDSSQPARHTGRTLGIYTSGFFAFVIMIAILEQIGMPANWIGYLFILVPVLVYAGIGIMTRTMRVPEFYIAGRRIPALQTGMAAGGDWISSAVFLSLAGSLYMFGYDGLSVIVGLAGGYVLIAVLIAPYLRKYGAYTLPDFFASRYGGTAARLIGIAFLIVCSFILAVAQIRVAGLVAERFLGISYHAGVLFALGTVMVCSILGGMRAITWTLVAQYVVLMFAYVIPILVLSMRETSLPVPQLLYGQALQQIAAFEHAMLESGQVAAETFKPYLTPFSHTSPANFFALILSFMLGTAALPHILARFFTTTSVRDTRQAVGWSLFFVMLLLVTAPGYAAFVRLEVYQTVIGSAPADMPDWIYTWGAAGKINLCGIAAATPDTVKAACDALGTPVIRYDDFSITQDVVVLAAPDIANLPYVVSGLLGAGILAAALSTANGLLLVIANAISHDIYYNILDRRAPTTRRLLSARILLIATGLAATYYAVDLMPADILRLVSWSFSLAAAGNFPALVLGIWWKRCTTLGGITGMLAGFATSLAYLIAYQHTGFSLFGIEDMGASLFGVPVGFAVTIGVSYLTTAPSAKIDEFIDDVRTPRGEPISDVRQEHKPVHTP